jgi:hypothetical protein
MLKMRRIMMVFMVAGFILTGCSIKNEMSSTDIENYRNYFEKFNVEETDKLTSPERYELDEWKKNISF